MVNVYQLDNDIFHIYIIYIYVSLIIFGTDVTKLVGFNSRVMVRVNVNMVTGHVIDKSICEHSTRRQFKPITSLYT